MNIPYVIKKFFFDLFGKAEYNKGLKVFDEEVVKAFENYAAGKVPQDEFITIENLIRILEEENLPEEVLREMFNTYNSEGWKFIKGYMQLLQRTIEKRLVVSDITDREFLTRRIEYSVYAKIMAYEIEIKLKYKRLQDEKADQALKQKPSTTRPDKG